VEVFVASEALAAGRVTRHQLAAHHRRIFPGVYAPKGTALSLGDRIAAAWLWSGRKGVVTGLAASALHGAKWISADTPVELNIDRHKSPPGVLIRRDTLVEGEIVHLKGMAVTTVARTAFDLARRGPRIRAVERLDSLCRATGFKADDVLPRVVEHPRVRGRRRVGELLELVDPGAQSPKESWLRMILTDAGFPRPRTQIPVLAPDGYVRYFLDMGWEELRVAAEYDGEQHRIDTVQFRKDVLRSEYLDTLGWRRIRVLAGHRRDDIVRRVQQAGVPLNF